VSDAPIGVLVMAYGTASGPDDIERYYTDIRGGHAPSREHLEELRARYAAIGNVFPLADITISQAEGLVHRLNAGTPPAGFKAYVGMKHSPPFVPDTVRRMHADGITEAVGIVMAPHWSMMSIETYIERVEKAVAELGGTTSFTFVRSYGSDPRFIGFLAERVSEALDELTGPERERVTVVFTAHSLPIRQLPDGSFLCKSCDCELSCRYRDGLQETADLVADRLGLANHSIAWQSAGRTNDPWWGPALEVEIPRRAAEGSSAVVVCSAGFAADHLEILYDLDVEAARIAREAGIGFARTRMPNADPGFLEVLAAVVGEQLASGRQERGDRDA
jgi:protoporphyrin/coproporphyrin ferrochelatase